MAKAEKKRSGKVFDIRLLPMDIGRIVYWFMNAIFLTKRIYVTPEAKKKIKDGAIIAANHTSFCDPLLLGSHYWYRRMFFLTAETVMKNNRFRVPLKAMGCIEIDRSICDMDSVRKSISVLKDGRLLAVFPQGGIDRTSDIAAIKSGIILMAFQAKAPIIPVYIHKKSGAHDRNCIVFGEPVNIFSDGLNPKLSDIDKYAEIILEKMIECKEKYKNTED